MDFSSNLLYTLDMPPKAGLLNQALKNTSEFAGETLDEAKRTAVKQAEDIIDEARRQISFFGLEPPPPPEIIKAKEDEELMRKLEGYKEIFRKIDAIEGRVTDEKMLDEKVRRYIEEEEKRAIESFRRMETAHRQDASSLSTPPQSEQQKTNEEQQEKIAEEEEGKRKEAEEQTRLENVVEAPLGKQTGLIFQGKRKSNPRRGTPRATRNLRGSAEQRVGRGLGG